MHFVYEASAKITLCFYLSHMALCTTYTNSECKHSVEFVDENKVGYWVQFVGFFLVFCPKTSP